MCINPMLSYRKENGEIEKLKNIPKLGLKTYEQIKCEDLVIIKCGKCDECRLERMLEMKTRIKNELNMNPKAYFLTLTYDEEHKKNLNIRDMQLFIKRLRKKQTLRYFWCGELGETTKRPHYHAIIFAELPKDLKETTNLTKKGHKQYESQFLTKTWGNGLVRISKMEKPLISYIVKYMLKNAGKKEFLSCWSRNPPLGINTNTIEKTILKPQTTCSEKRYYKKHIGEMPKNIDLEEKQLLKIKAIKELTKKKYLDYINGKRDYYI